MTRIKDWPASERPRERLIKQGANHLTDAELLALFMGSGTKGQSAVDLARNALGQVGSLAKLLALDVKQFCCYPGFGHATYCQLQGAMEIGHRYHQQHLESTNVLTTPETTKRFVQHKLQTQHREVFACLFLNNKCQLLHYRELFYGTINRSQIHLREILKLGLEYNASGLIITHNHPSGDPAPSQHDKAITLQLKDILDYVDIALWDHLIVGKNRVFSFCEAGLI